MQGLCRLRKKSYFILFFNNDKMLVYYVLTLLEEANLKWYQRDRGVDMLENINSSIEKNPSLKITTQFKMPKNIRQVGNSIEGKKIFIEDYVMSYMKKSMKEEGNEQKAFVLMGHYVCLEDGNKIFIQGAVHITNEELFTRGEITNDDWSAVYERINTYFQSMDIVGWLVISPTFETDFIEKIHRMYLNNFAGQDKALMQYDSIEKEEKFFLYEGNGFKEQQGYYIYYERNEEMQNYMLESISAPSSEEGYEDRAAKEIRQILQVKKQEKDGKSTTKLMYATGFLMVVIVLVIASALLNNYEEMRNLEKALETISNEISKEDNQNIVYSAKEPEEIYEAGDETGKKGGKVTVIDNTGIDKEVKAENEQKGEKEKLEETPPEDIQESIDDKKDNMEEKKVDVEEDLNYEVLPTTMESYNSYIVERGDTLAGICLKLYGSFSYKDEIIKLNQISNQNMIYEGQKLIIP